VSLDELLAELRREVAAGERGAGYRSFWRAVDAELCRMYRGRYTRAERGSLISDIEVAVWKKLDTYQQTGPSSFNAWLRAVAQREEQSFVRDIGREKSRRERLVHLPRKSTQRISAWLLDREQRAIVDRYTLRLLTPQREALELDPFDLARREEITVRAARMRRRRALRRLLRLLTLSRHRSETVRYPSP